LFSERPDEAECQRDNSYPCDTTTTKRSSAQVVGACGLPAFGEPQCDPYASGGKATGFEPKKDVDGPNS
jgi:hypothetical protein